MTIRVEHADMLQAIPRLVAEGVVCDAVVTDPPYHLTSLPSRTEVPGKWGQRTEAQKLARAAAGFMNQTWDGGDIAFRPETWAIVATILRPGAFLVAFGGTRTYHRLACAIEDGGFVIQDCILWLYATGFPKRRDALKPAYEPIICARKKFSTSPDWCTIAEFTARLEALLWTVTPAPDVVAIERETENSARWLVHALRKWLREESAATDTFNSLGEVSISLSIALLWNATLVALSTNESTFTTEMRSSLTIGLRTLNSWLSEITPANITLAVSRRDGLWPTASIAESNSTDARPIWSGIPTVFVAERVMPHTMSALLSALADIVASSSLLPPATVASFVRQHVPIGSTTHCVGIESSAPALSVAPFLRLSPDGIQNIAAENAWPSHTGLDLSPDYLPIVLAYKPGGKRTMQIDECRIGGGEDKGVWPITGRRKTMNILGHFSYHSITDRSLGRWPANLAHDWSDEVLAAFAAYGERDGAVSNGRLGVHGVVYSDGLGPRPQLPGRADTGSAARFFFSAKAGAQDRWGSKHPTVKPVELIKWLVALVTPPGGLALDPFAGSGTTGVAALATGRNAILIEREANYYEDIKARLAHYEGAGAHSLSAKGRRRDPITSGGVGTPLFDGAAS